MALIRPDETKAHGKYLYYYFFSEEWRSTVSSHIITGATVDRIPIAKFPKFIISLPPMEKQHKRRRVFRIPRGPAPWQERLRG